MEDLRQKNEWKRMWREIPISQKIVRSVLGTIITVGLLIIISCLIMINLDVTFDLMLLWISLGVTVSLLVFLMVYSTVVVKEGIVKREIAKSFDKEKFDR